MLSTENSPTVSLMRPLLHQLLEVTKPVPDVDSPLIHQAKATMHHDLEKRYHHFVFLPSPSRKCQH